MFDTGTTTSASTAPATATRWSEMPPGSAVVAVLERPPDPGDPPAERLERIGAFERVINSLQALQSCEIAALVEGAESTMARHIAEHDPATDPPLGLFDTVPDALQSIVAELRLMLRLTTGSAWYRVDEARGLSAAELAPVAELARAGLLSRSKVLLLVEAATDLTPEQTERLLTRVLPKAPGQTTGQLRAAIRRFLTGLPDGVRARRRERRTLDRGVRVQAEADGMATLRAFLPAAAATGILAVVDQHARGCGSADPRGMDARRADALVDLVLRDTGRVSAGTALATGAASAEPTGVPGLASAPAGGSPFVRNTVRVNIHVTVPLDTLTGAGDEPAELAGFGPIPAEDARALAFDPASVWDRLVTDPVTGKVLDHGTQRYRPPADLARLVRSRHGCCAHPGCRTPAHRCDIDHVVPFDPVRATGPTSAGNTAPLCRSHHRLKHMPGWHVEMRPNGTLVWTTPSGHTYEAQPSPVGPVRAEAGPARGPSPWARGEASGPSPWARGEGADARDRFAEDVAEPPF
ncbi:DUF222 domain-containing protein [Pseudonocardia sp. NPDC046786]|uniref:HNH endonuclease signature motif containing protein n=1 Tax=Pseudonocardia sp. NPDC046786 TaxID=3155471 RepID=UPI0033C68476